MTNKWAKPRMASVFVIKEAATGKVWGISGQEKYANQRAEEIAKTLEINMDVEWQDSEGHVVNMTYLRGYEPKPVWEA